MHILIVDDDDFALQVLEATLGRMGYPVIKAHDGREALQILRQGDIRLVITDWEMPVMDGLELCRAIRREELSGYVYIIMLTGREGADQRIQGLFAGADDFLNKPLDPEELLVCLKTAERILALETRDLALFALAKLAESRDAETGAHIERVQSYSRIIAKNLSDEVKAVNGVDDEFIRLLYQTSPLHDLGKVGIPDAILLKPGKLTPGEFAIMETHTVIGAQTLDAALQRFPHARFLQMAKEIAATHHEHFDGSGYPCGLTGDEIPLSGRIVAVADVYDALSSRRVYKEAMPHERAKALIVQGSGSQFDPEVVDAFLRSEAHIVSIAEQMRDAVEVAPPKPAISVPAPSGQGGPRPCGILIVEDEPILMHKLDELIAATGEQVYRATNGQAALELWRRHHPRVVLSDWVMPIMDGVELCQQIRAESHENPAHFIMLTAHSDRGRLLDAYRAGVDDFLSKPFDPEELLARVRAGIRTAKLHDELIQKATGTQALNAQLAVVNSRLERLAITDELTGLFNRRHAMFRLEEQWALAERYSRPVTIAMIDIDHFKSINDTYGHDVGDSILRRVAGLLRDQTRGTDAVCRVGGEEFLIISPALTLQEVAVCAERCRTTIANHVFNISNAEIRTTVSIGVATRTTGLEDFPDLLRLADQALYAAKSAGRNTIRTSENTNGAPQMSNSTTNLQNGSSSEAEISPIDASAILKRCGGDAKFAASITEHFRVQAAGEVAQIEQALASSNVDGLRRAAHNLKSMAAYVSADTASALAKEIEDLARQQQLGPIPPLLERLRSETDRAIRWISQKGLAA
ncbi:MAG TPA: response regulator, partial [Tepidisphaeraceae bacterium]|nr:response regulator [Tepidisphaeraceae bacterium]